MKKTTLLLALLLVPFTLAQAQPAPAPVGDVIGVGNFLHVVGDTEPVFNFYRTVLGMDVTAAVAAAPPVIPRPYVTTPEIQNLYDAAGVPYRNSVTLVNESPMRMESVEWNTPKRATIHPQLQDPGAGVMVMHVRDLDAILARVQQAHATVVTTGGKPVTITGPEGSSRRVMLQDPEGFFVELVQPQKLPASAARASNNIYDIGFAVTVGDMARMVEAFRTMGFEPALGAWRHDAAQARLAGVPLKAGIRRATAFVPGSTFEVTLTEFRGVPQKHWQSTSIDPGTAMLRLRASNMDALIARLGALGYKVGSKDGQPVTVVGANGSQRFVIVNGPDNLKIQFVQAVPKPN